MIAWNPKWNRMSARSHELSGLASKTDGWANVPPGTRTSLYANVDYQKAAPFAKMTLDSVKAADPLHPTVKPVPYVRAFFVAIPEFQGIGDSVGQLFAAAVAGQMSSDVVLKKARELTTRRMTKAGYVNSCMGHAINWSSNRRRRFRRRACRMKTNC